MSTMLLKKVLPLKTDHSAPRGLKEKASIIRTLLEASQPLLFPKLSAGPSFPVILAPYLKEG